MPGDFKLKFILTFSGVLFALSFRLSAQSLTLEQCIQTALRQNNQVLEIEQSIQDAEAKVSEAWGYAWPTLSLQAKHEKIFKQYNPLGSIGGGDPNANPFVNTAPYMDPNDPVNYDPAVSALAGDMGNLLQGMLSGISESMAYNYQTSVNLVLTQILFAQGKISTGLDIAKAYKQLLSEQRSLLHSQVRLSITRAFNRALYAREAVAIYMESIEQATEHLKQVEAMHQAGFVSEIDFLRASLQIEELTAGRDQMAKNLLLAKNALLNLMGTPYSNSVELEGRLEEPAPFNAEYNSQEVINKRLEFKQLNNARTIQNKLVDIEAAEYLPAVFAGGSLSKISTANAWNEFNWGDDQRIFIGLEWTLFNGLQTRNKIAQAKTETAKIDVSVNHLKNSVELQIESEKNNVDEARNRLSIRKKMLDLAERNLKIINVSYAAGQVTQLDVLDASMELRRAQLQQQEALLDLNNATDNLKMALGEY
jgi:OMF family outer membrane factor